MTSEKLKQGIDVRLPSGDDWGLVFNSMNELAMILAPDHRILAANNPVLKATGLTTEEITGRYCYEIFHCTDHPPEGCPHKLLMDSREPATMDMEMAVFDGTFMVSVTPVFDENGKLVKSIHIAKDITDRKKYEQELFKTNRTLQCLSECNSVLIHSNDEARLLEDICRVIVKVGGFRLVWVGFALDDEDSTVRPAAYFGYNDDYLETIKISWSATEEGDGPTGTAIRSGKASICHDIQQDPLYAPWRQEALNRGYNSSIALPIAS